MRLRPHWLGLLSLVPVLQAQTVNLEPVVVTAARRAEAAQQVPFSVTVLPGENLREAPAASLDGALRSVPGFSLFRRSDSLTANPTTQGVSLRGLGPSGASRSLVLLDGVPLNDPFGGWVAWSKVPRESLARAELLRGGGATAWGNAALGGVVQLFTEDPAAAPDRFAASFGSFATRSIELAVAAPAGPGRLQLLARDFTTNGYAVVAPEDRGPVDLAATSEHRWLTARWQQAIAPDLQLTVTGRSFREERGNGTPYQRNSSREEFASVVLDAHPGHDFSWTATAYRQDQSFASTFSAVNAGRTAETPASDQFGVPGTAVGASWSGGWSGTPGARTSAGVDLREVRGETRENFLYASGSFTRRRVAGGAQDSAGLFALHEQALGAEWRATAGGRLDFWRERDGNRRETDRVTGTVLRDDHYAGDDRLAFSPSLGLVWQAAPAWRLHTAAQQSFRRPTLNELYRPFRAGSVVTEANAALKTEHARTAEIGADYAAGPLFFGATLFWNGLRDAVANVTVARGPGTFPVVGFLPAGGTGRQRLNLDEIRVQGLELSSGWRLGSSLSLRADFLYNEATVRRASVAPALVGKWLAQVPRTTGSAGISWLVAGRLSLTPRVRWLGRQFEDDENQLRLGAALVVDCGAGYRLDDGWEIFATVENLTNERIETGRSADGLVNTGTPRLGYAGIRRTW